MACDCIDQVDAKLQAEHNTRLDLALSLNGKPPAVIVRTSLLEKKRGAKAGYMVATYCPFCGRRYGEVKA